MAAGRPGHNRFVDLPSTRGDVEAEVRAQIVAAPGSFSVGRPGPARSPWPGSRRRGLAYVGLRNPTSGGFVPCPFHAITGLWCPGCGMTRALHHLLHGDVAGAVSSNLFLPVVVVVVGWAWLAWAVPRRARRSPRSCPPGCGPR